MLASPCPTPTRIRVAKFAPCLVTLVLVALSQFCPARAEVFTLGYLTGSQRRPGNLDYHRPGLTISGAISLAVEQVNMGALRDRGHTLEFVVAETFGEEVTSIRQTAALWTQQVAAYIGPQETCVHEGRMAAAFNLPMISYVSWGSTTKSRSDEFFSSTAPIEIHQTRPIFQLLHERGLPTPKSPSRLWLCFWPLTGHR